MWTASERSGLDCVRLAGLFGQDVQQKGSFWLIISAIYIMTMAIDKAAGMAIDNMDNTQTGRRVKLTLWDNANLFYNLNDKSFVTKQVGLFLAGLSLFVLI